jgi:hypothetical protein
MATSGDYNFNLSTYKIITGAMRLISAIQSGETPPAEEYDDALDALNGMMMHFQASGIHVWSEIEAILFLQPLQRTYSIGIGSTDHACPANDWLQTYLTNTALAGASSITVAATSDPRNTILANDWIGILLDQQGQTPPQIFWTRASGPPSGSVVSLTTPLPSQASQGARVIDYTHDLVRPLKVPAGRRLIFAGNTGIPPRIETPMAIYSRIDYGSIPNKDTLGEITAFFYDPQLGMGLMNVWPNPINVSTAMTFTAQRPLQDFVSQRDNADLPVEWISCLRYNLAVELAPEYDVPAERFGIIQAIAGAKLATCSSWDREPESIYFGVGNYPDTRNT